MLLCTFFIKFAKFDSNNSSGTSSKSEKLHHKITIEFSYNFSQICSFFDIS
ncbi:MAG: hypothetical protein Q8S84_01000 [bacterium]|nr:hypothetical protein [bacterium]